MKKAFIIILAAVMLLPLMFSCGNDGDISISDSSADSTASQNSDPDVPVKDMGGREFRVLCPDFGAGSNSILGYTGEVLYSEENPDSVDEAKKAVIERVQNDYNCKIDGIVDSATPVFQTVRNQVSSGNIEYDIVFDSTGNAAVLALEHNLYDLNDISTIDLSASWWDQNAVNDLALGGHLYFVMGDINTYDNQGTWCMIFNKDLKRKLGISEDFYALARDGKWDFDTFAEICRRDGISRDLNSDGVMDEKDQWAFGTETYNIYVHYISAGKKIALPDGDGIPYLTMNTDMTATANILTHVLDFYNEKESWSPITSLIRTRAFPMSGKRRCTRHSSKGASCFTCAGSSILPPSARWTTNSAYFPFRNTIPRRTDTTTPFPWAIPPQCLFPTA